MGVSIVGLAQGIPFLHIGQDILRSKSLDRNSYDSGDWFNRVDWSYGDGSYANNFGVGLPPAWDNQSRWDIMGPHLTNTALDPAATDAQFSAAHLREMLRIRKSSPLFRLTSESEINTRTGFYTENAPAGLLVMSLSDDVGAAGLDPNYGTILVFFNANKTQASFTIAGANSFTLHPIQDDTTDADPVVQTASFNDGTDTFTIPARTTAVFVSTEAITPPLVVSSIDWVGLMYPRGGMSTQRTQGSGDDVIVYVQVYEPGITGNSGSHVGIACTLFWGRYGSTWSELPMSRNMGFPHSSNDEHTATISQAALNALAPGQVGYTAFCKKAGEDKKWKVDSTNIDGNSNTNFAEDNDVGDGIISITPTADAAPAPPAGVFVHLFEWRWTDIQKECPYLASKGYSGVQVSPPMEHLVPTADQFGVTTNDYPWWVRYQPVSYSLAQSRSGTLAEFQAMVNACNVAGVDIIADAVINHMTGPGSSSITYTGTAGSPFRKYQYPYPAQSLYGPSDFHSYIGACPSTGGEISNYTDRRQVQRCELSGLSDLNTAAGNVQTAIRNYLQSLLNMGVKGFRIDGAKHIAAHELSAILAGLTGDFYVFQEVIDYDTNEPVKEYEYFAAGDVTEFGYSIDAIGKKFNGVDNGKLADLESLPNWPGMMDSRFAVVFTDNHDNQRGHGPGGSTIVDHRDGQLYNLANIFMLGHPYGNYVSVMSSYYWSNDPGTSAGDSKGPPSATAPHVSGSGGDTRPVYGPSQVPGDVPANCSAAFEDGKWVCEHRRTSIANMVKFRQVTHGQLVTHWQNIGGASSNHIAFGRGDKGFVAINRTGSPATTTYETGMAPGSYCDITKYDYIPSTGQCIDPVTTVRAPDDAWIIVNGSGQIVDKMLGAMDAFAIYQGAQPTAITLAEFSAIQAGDHVLVTWETASELDNRGFNLHRGTSPDEPDRQLNSTLIPSQSQGNPGGFTYTWDDYADLVPGTTYYYWVEDVDLSGVTTMHGPVSVDFIVPTAVTLGGMQANPTAGAAALPALWVAVAAGAALGLGRVRRR
jgi:glycosidase